VLSNLYPGISSPRVNDISTSPGSAFGATTALGDPAGVNTLGATFLGTGIIKSSAVSVVKKYIPSLFTASSFTNGIAGVDNGSS